MAGRKQVAVPQRSGDLEDVPKVLLCPDNAGTSLMAEALLNDLARGRLAGTSAGIRPADRPRPEVVQAMAEVGIRIEEQQPGRLLTADLAESAVRIVAIRCELEEACPGVTTPVDEWPIPEVEGKSSEEVEAIRDGIEIRVRNLTASLLRD